MVKMYGVGTHWGKSWRGHISKSLESYIYLSKRVEMSVGYSKSGQ